MSTAVASNIDVAYYPTMALDATPSTPDASWVHSIVSADFSAYQILLDQLTPDLVLSAEQKQAILTASQSESGILLKDFQLFHQLDRGVAIPQELHLLAAVYHVLVNNDSSQLTQTQIISLKNNVGLIAAEINSIIVSLQELDQLKLTFNEFLQREIGIEHPEYGLVKIPLVQLNFIDQLAIAKKYIEENSVAKPPSVSNVAGSEQLNQDNATVSENQVLTQIIRLKSWLPGDQSRKNKVLQQILAANPGINIATAKAIIADSWHQWESQHYAEKLILPMKNYTYATNGKVYEFFSKSSDIKKIIDIMVLNTSSSQTRNNYQLQLLDEYGRVINELQVYYHGTQISHGTTFFDRYGNALPVKFNAQPDAYEAIQQTLSDVVKLAEKDTDNIKFIRLLSGNYNKIVMGRKPPTNTLVELLSKPENSADTELLSFCLQNYDPLQLISEPILANKIFNNFAAKGVGDVIVENLANDIFVLGLLENHCELIAPFLRYPDFKAAILQKFADPNFLKIFFARFDLDFLAILQDIPVIAQSIQSQLTAQTALLDIWLPNDTIDIRRYHLILNRLLDSSLRDSFLDKICDPEFTITLLQHLQGQLGEQKRMKIYYSALYENESVKTAIGDWFKVADSEHINIAAFNEFRQKNSAFNNILSDITVIDEQIKFIESYSKVKNSKISSDGGIMLDGLRMTSERENRIRKIYIQPINSAATNNDGITPVTATNAPPQLSADEFVELINQPLLQTELAPDNETTDIIEYIGGNPFELNSANSEQEIETYSQAVDLHWNEELQPNDNLTDIITALNPGMEPARELQDLLNNPTGFPEEPIIPDSVEKYPDQRSDVKSTLFVNPVDQPNTTNTVKNNVYSHTSVIPVTPIPKQEFSPQQAAASITTNYYSADINNFITELNQQIDQLIAKPEPLNFLGIKKDNSAFNFDHPVDQTNTIIPDQLLQQGSAITRRAEQMAESFANKDHLTAADYAALQELQTATKQLLQEAKIYGQAGQFAFLAGVELLLLELGITVQNFQQNPLPKNTLEVVRAGVAALAGALATGMAWLWHGLQPDGAR